MEYIIPVAPTITMDHITKEMVTPFLIRDQIPLKVLHLMQSERTQIPILGFQNRFNSREPSPMLGTDGTQEGAILNAIILERTFSAGQLFRRLSWKPD